MGQNFAPALGDSTPLGTLFQLGLKAGNIYSDYRLDNLQQNHQQNLQQKQARFDHQQKQQEITLNQKQEDLRSARKLTQAQARQKTLFAAQGLSANGGSAKAVLDGITAEHQFSQNQNTQQNNLLKNQADAQYQLQNDILSADQKYFQEQQKWRTLKNVTSLF